MQLLAIIVPVLISAILTAVMVPCIIRLSYKKKLFDKVNERKVHSGVVPRLGGGAFILAVVVAVAIAVFMSDVVDVDCVLSGGCGAVRYVALILAAMIIYLAGVWDDIRSINYKLKFLCQLVSALLIVLVGDYWINDVAGLFGVYALSPLVGKTFTVLLIMYIINAFNLIDGIDGLASSLGFVATLVMGILFAYTNQVLMAVLALALSVALMVFFCYNKFGSEAKHTKIFMGDGGSQTMGLIISFLVVYMSMKMPESPNNVFFQSPVVAFCLIVIPCFDAVRVMVGRMLKGNNPFLPDQTHIHHKFLRIGYSVGGTLAGLLLLDIFIIATNVLIMVCDINMDVVVKINFVLILDVAIWCLVHLWLNARLAKKEGKNLKN